MDRISIVASELGRFVGAIGVGIGGSRALGLNRQRSDWDIVVVHSDEKYVPPSEIRHLLNPYCDPGSIRTVGSYFSGSCGGEDFEVFQKSLPSIQSELARARAGQFGWRVAPLYPHGDLSTRVLAHIYFLKIAWQDRDSLANLQASLLPYPKELKRSLSTYFSLRAAECSHHLRNSAANIGALEALSFYSAFVAYLAIVIFAANDMYPVIEKGRDALIEQLECKPANYSHRLQICLALLQSTNVVGATNAMDELLAESMRSLAVKPFPKI